MVGLWQYVQISIKTISNLLLHIIHYMFYLITTPGAYVLYILVIQNWCHSLDQKSRQQLQILLLILLPLLIRTLPNFFSPP